MTDFELIGYSFDRSTGVAKFDYGFSPELRFTEAIKFSTSGQTYDEGLFDKALQLAFVLSGTSYYKTFPSRRIKTNLEMDSYQVRFFDTVYQEGMSQFAFENQLGRDDLGHFAASTEADLAKPVDYQGEGLLALQSGGKDSLLLTSLLNKKGLEFNSLYVLSGGDSPEFLNGSEFKLLKIERQIDKPNLLKVKELGARNGHIPITYIITSLAIAQAILLNKKTILTSIAHEGEEPHSVIGDLAVNHQWSKSWRAEQLLADYIKKYLSAQLEVGSPLRCYSELKVAELFYDNAWSKYAGYFSSCNLANYSHFEDRSSKLTWCCACPKCANAFLLFAPFVPSQQLKAVFSGKDLFAELSLIDTYKGLLGIDDFKKPLECVSEIDELRLAYHMAQAKVGFAILPFAVPTTDFDYNITYPCQEDIARIIL